jgi:hypothetical protein
MATDKQIEANRLNALKSTGPKSLSGKAVVRMNGATHGLSAKDVVLAGEDEPAFLALAGAFYSDHRPIGKLQQLLVERMICAFWKLRPLGRIETEIFDHQACSDYVVNQIHRRNFGDDDDYDDEDEDGDNQNASPDPAPPPTPPAVLPRDITHGLSFMRGANDLAKLSRYEVRIERSFYKALHELQRLQAVDAGQSVPPPAVIDVDLGIDFEPGPD